MNSLQNLLRRPVFDAGRVYDWADVVLFGARSGEWPRFEQEVRQGIGCLDSSDPSDEVENEIEAMAAHKFVLGHTGAGIIMILLSCTGISSVISLIEGIIYLTKSDEEFIRIYQVEKKAWF